MSGTEFSSLSHESVATLHALLIEKKQYSREKVLLPLDVLGAKYSAGFKPFADLNDYDRLEQDLIKINESGRLHSGQLPMEVFLQQLHDKETVRDAKEKLAFLLDEVERRAGSNSDGGGPGMLLYLSFLGRQSCWQEAASRIESWKMPHHFSLAETGSNTVEKYKSVALLWEYEHNSDYVEYFANAMCYWLKVGGDISCKRKENQNKSSKTFKLPWTPQWNSMQKVCDGLVDEMRDKYDLSISGFDTRNNASKQSEFAGRIVDFVNNKCSDEFCCIHTQISRSRKAIDKGADTERKVAESFVSFWNSEEQRQYWKKLKKPLVFIVFVEKRPDGLFNRLTRKKRTDETTLIGKHTADSFRQWFDFFLPKYGISFGARLNNIRNEIDDSKWEDIRFGDLAKKLDLSLDR